MIFFSLRFGSYSKDFCRTDQQYVPASFLTGVEENPHVQPSPHVATPPRVATLSRVTTSRTVPSHNTRSTPRSPSRSQSLPPTDNPRARFLTPPPTPAPRRPPTSRRVTARTHEPPSPRLLRDGAVPCEERGTPEFHPTPITKDTRFQTLLYPLLRDAELLQYFGREDGVSKRPANGKEVFCPTAQSSYACVTEVREMLRRISLDRTWLGDTSYVNTTDVDCSHRKIQQPPANSCPSRWYVVIMGTDVGIFPSWFV